VTCCTTCKHTRFVAGAGIHISRAHVSDNRVASAIAEDAWSGSGVHVFVFRCGAVAYAAVGSNGDALLLRRARAQLIGTWARGARFDDVLANIRAGRADARA